MTQEHHSPRPRHGPRPGRRHGRARPGQPRRGAALVDVRRRVRGRQGTGQRLPAGRRHLGRFGHRRRRAGACGGHQPHGRRHAAHRGAVQHVQAVPRPHRPGHARQRRRGGGPQRLGQDPARADPELDQDQGPLLRRAGGHPHAGLVLVLQGGVRQGRHRRRAEDARRVLRRPRQAEGRRHRAARLRRPAVAGEDHVLRVARARGWPRRCT
jgi:hypothetical protein